MEEKSFFEKVANSITDFFTGNGGSTKQAPSVENPSNQKVLPSQDEDDDVGADDEEDEHCGDRRVSSCDFSKLE